MIISHHCLFQTNPENKGGYEGEQWLAMDKPPTIYAAVQTKPKQGTKKDIQRQWIAS